MQFEYIAVSAVIALGAFTQGLTGFGLALVSVPLLSMAINVKMAVPIAGVFGWFVTFPAVWKMRKHVQWKTGLLLFAGSLPGSFVGADLLKRLPGEVILIAMGVVLVASSIYSLSSSKPLFNRTTRPITLGTGFFSGALGASVGEPGPPVIAYTARLDTPVADFLNKMISEGLEHHTALTYGDHRPVMRALAKRLGIEVVELT